MKYLAAHGTTTAAKKFKTEDKPLNERSACRFSDFYKEELKQAKTDEEGSRNKLCRRPLLLGYIDHMVQRILLVLQSQDGIVLRTIIVFMAKAVITLNPQHDLVHIDLDSSEWARSLFQIMSFAKRMQKTGKVKIPTGAKKEAELHYLHDIVSVEEKRIILSDLVMNLDQTPLKYISIIYHTMSRTSSKSVPIIGSAAKRSITGTFVVTLDRQFLLMQLIYGGKNVQSLLRFMFPDSFYLSANPKHCINTHDSTKVIAEILVPYVKYSVSSWKNLIKPLFLIVYVI